MPPAARSWAPPGSSTIELKWPRFVASRSCAERRRPKWHLDCEAPWQRSQDMLSSWQPVATVIWRSNWRQILPPKRRALIAQLVDFSRRQPLPGARQQLRNLGGMVEPQEMETYETHFIFCAGRRGPVLFFHNR